MNNLYAVIMAGGIGERMGSIGSIDKPKQFLIIGSKPIILHTVEKFLINNKFDKIIIPCHKEWMIYMEALLKKHFRDLSKIDIVNGGEDRNRSIMNAIKHIENNYELNENTLIVTHDGVRPFVTQRIIEDNISCIEKGVVCDTVVKATDTVVESVDGKYIRNIPERSHIYNSQTPQSFPAMKFVELYNSLEEEEKCKLTDAAKVFVIKGEQVAMIQGEDFNIKVTYPKDLLWAELVLKDDQNA